MSNIRRALRTTERFRTSPLSIDYDDPMVSSESTVVAHGSRDGSAARSAPSSVKDAFEMDVVSRPARLDWTQLGKSASARMHPEYPLLLDRSHAVASESFSILRSRLLSVHKKLGIRSVVITSA